MQLALSVCVRNRIRKEYDIIFVSGPCFRLLGKLSHQLDIDEDEALEAFIVDTIQVRAVTVRRFCAVIGDDASCNSSVLFRRR